MVTGLALYGADINKGYTFTVGEQNITHTKLNNLVDAASINTTFFTDKSATTTPVAADTMLIYQSSGAGYRKCTLGNFLFGNAAVITGQTEDTLPVGGDFLLTYDVSAAGLKKSQLDSLVFTNAAFLSARSNWVAPISTAFVLGYESGSGLHYKFSISNLFYNYANFSTFTNVARQTIFSAEDQILMWTKSWGTNRLTSLAGLVTNSVDAIASPQVGDFLWGYKASNAAPTKWTFGYVRTNVANQFVSGFYPVGLGVIADIAHGLAGTPQSVSWALVCTNTAGDATSQYVCNDEIPLGVLGTTITSVGANATNVFAACGSATWTVAKRDGSTTVNPSARANFAARCRATYFPP